MKSSKTKYLLPFLNIFLTSMLSYSQKKGNIWYFGNNDGIDFNSEPLVAITNITMRTNEGCSSISDNIGNLLFYTDGNTVWNRNHVPMPNGFDLMGHSSSTQSALIRPKPGSSSIYYIFTTPAQVSFDNRNGFRYSIVDITLNNGLGDIATKNNLLYDPVTEKLIAVKHANGHDVWIVIHEWNSNRFQAYLVYTSGINPTYIITNIGSVHTGNTLNTLGQLKASPDGSKLTLAIRGQFQREGPLELFDFNNATGEVSNLLPSPIFNPYGIEFSPDGAKLYVSAQADLFVTERVLYQYNLYSKTVIINTLPEFNFGNDTVLCHGIPMILNAATPEATYLWQDSSVNSSFAVSAPDLYWVEVSNACGSDIDSILIDYFPPWAVDLGNDTTLCTAESLLLDATAPRSNYNWQDNSTASSYTVTDPGFYHVKVTNADGCSNSDSVTIDFSIPPVVNLGNDTIFCKGQSLDLVVNLSGVTYV